MSSLIWPLLPLFLLSNFILTQEKNQAQGGPSLWRLTMSQYQHLTLEDRVLIKTKLEAACSFRKIAKDLGKSPTT
ncbi:MAG TPA: helix-turn-helix domain-containing protein, partial [Clostridia bacterium]|nr:helix-turn-helix domain-containing protein [Clostridia bacterium]